MSIREAIGSFIDLFDVDKQGVYCNLIQEFRLRGPQNVLTVSPIGHRIVSECIGNGGSPDYKGRDYHA